MSKAASRADRSGVFVALLRGVNVGGRHNVSMKTLKATFEALSLQDVRTYINSGNVLFRSATANVRSLERDIDRVLAAEHGLESTAVVRSEAEIARLVKTIDRTWTPDARWKYNVMFLRHAVDAPGVLKGIALKPDIERAVYCPGTLLWSAQIGRASCRESGGGGVGA